MLSSWEVKFDGVDVEADPARIREFAAAGIPRVPAVVVGDRWVHGWNPRALAQLVGVDYRDPTRLPPAELARRLDEILAGAQRATCQVPPDALALKCPDRDRTVRQLAHHLFRLSLAFRDSMAEGRLPEAWLTEDPPPTLHEGAAIAEYGQTVIDQLRRWFAEPRRYDETIQTYYGPQTAHELLERTTWHAAQHLRQLYALLEQLGIRPDRPVGGDLFAGLPLPREVWS